MADNLPCDEHHHRSSLPNSIEDSINDIYSPNYVELFMNSMCIHEVILEKNLSNIEEIIPLGISIKLGVVENLHIGESYSPSEIETY